MLNRVPDRDSYLRTHCACVSLWHFVEVLAYFRHVRLSASPSEIEASPRGSSHRSPTTTLSGSISGPNCYSVPSRMREVAAHLSAVRRTWAPESVMPLLSASLDNDAAMSNDEKVDWSEKGPVVTALLSHIHGRFPHITVREPSVRLVSAAYLARCCRLLTTMLRLRSDGSFDVVTLPLRPLFEAWLVALWLLFGGDDALDKLLEDYQSSLEKINRLAGLDWDPALYEAGDKLPSYETLSQWVGDHLEGEGQADAREHLDFTYNLVYRGESLRSVHAGCGTVVGHLREVGERVEVTEVRSEASHGEGEILWAATLVAMLAHRIFEVFHLGTELLDELSSQLPPEPTG